MSIPGSGRLIRTMKCTTITVLLTRLCGIGLPSSARLSKPCAAGTARLVQKYDVGRPEGLATGTVSERREVCRQLAIARPLDHRAEFRIVIRRRENPRFGYICLGGTLRGTRLREGVNELRCRAESKFQTLIHLASCCLSVCQPFANYHRRLASRVRGTHRAYDRMPCVLGFGA